MRICLWCGKKVEAAKLFPIWLEREASGHIVKWMMCVGCVVGREWRKLFVEAEGDD